MADRPPEKYRTSLPTTSFGSSGSHSPVRSVLHRLGPPGGLSVNPGAFFSFSSLAVTAGFSSFGMLEVKADVMQQPAVVVQSEQE